MPLRIGQRPDRGFDEPLGLLSDCHRRIEHFLQVFVTVAAGAAGGALTAAQRDALEGALRYFEVAAPKHTADEEESLFPRLREANDPGVRDALDVLAELETRPRRGRGAPRRGRRADAAVARGRPTDGGRGRRTARPPGASAGVVSTAHRARRRAPVSRGGGRAAGGPAARHRARNGGAPTHHAGDGRSHPRARSGAADRVNGFTARRTRK